MKALILLYLALPALAAPPPLSFSARIQDEALAEEAIDLLHCLAERRGTSWELGLEESAPSVRMDEKAGHLEGTYRTERPRSFVLHKNGWRRTCDELEPAEGAAAAAGALSPSAASSPLEETSLAQPSAGGGKRPWLWIGVGAAALVGGFILWRSRRPDHRALRMD